MVVVPTCVAVTGGGGARVCGSGRRWLWCPRVWQWKAVVLMPTCGNDRLYGGGAHVCGSGRRCGGEARVAVVVVPTCVAVEGGGGGAHVCGSGRR